MSVIVANLIEALSTVLYFGFFGFIILKVVKNSPELLSALETAIKNRNDASDGRSVSTSDAKTAETKYERSPAVREYYERHPERCPDRNSSVSYEHAKNEFSEKSEKNNLKDSPRFCNMEDRQNDWLAEQEREERKSLFRISDMLDMKLSHEKHCDAEEIKKRYR